jgi:hypothetical protein
LLASQKITVQRAKGSAEALALAAQAVEIGERVVLNTRSTKADFIVHAEKNSEASRAMNMSRV